MYNFTSFDANEFDEAITTKDYIKIKSFMVSAIRNNPRFRKAPGQDASEVKIALRILEERIPDIFEQYKVQEGEHPFNEEEADTWDEEYFIRQSFWLEENFSKKRLENLKRVGEKIGEKRSNFQEPQGQETGLQNRWLTGIVIILVIILLILIVVLVAKPEAALIMKPATVFAAEPEAALMTNAVAVS